MGLQGLTRRSKACKICLAVQDDDTLNELTKDILLKRRSYEEISRHYSPALVANGFQHINDVNIANHRRHCDPKLLAQSLLSEQGVPATPEDSVKRFYEQRFTQEVDRLELMNLGYKARLQGLEDLQKILESRKHEMEQYQQMLQQEPNDLVARTKIQQLERVIGEMTTRVMSEQRYIQDTALKQEQLHHHVAPDAARLQDQLVEMVVRETKECVVNFMRDFKGYLMTDVFSEDPARSKVVLHYMTTLLVRDVLAPLTSVLTHASFRRITEAKFQVMAEPPKAIESGQSHG